tara:strand:+ start:370 stop:948 length:579 start_codon:yes stop_codon:yes gene_type:complete
MNFEKIQEQLFDATKSQNQLIFQETLALSKLKNTWIAQIVTVSGTILGGVSVFTSNKNIATYIGLLILFSTIVIGIIIINNNLRNESNKLTEYFATFNDYNLRAIMLSELELLAQNRSLNQAELLQKSKLESELKKILDKWDLLDENGNLKMLSEFMLKDKMSIGNYILIVGLAVGGILITMAEIITNCGFP